MLDIIIVIIHKIEKQYWGKPFKESFMRDPTKPNNPKGIENKKIRNKRFIRLAKIFPF